MKYIKIYESIPIPQISDSIKESNFKLGDYVIADNDTFRCENIEVKNFLKNNVGIIMCIAKRSHDIDYINIPSYIIESTINRIVFRNSIVFYTEDIRLATSEEIEQYKLQKYTNKYNL